MDKEPGLIRVDASIVVIQAAIVIAAMTAIVNVREAAVMDVREEEADVIAEL